MASGYTNHFDGSPTPGVLQGVADKSILVNPGDIEAIRAAFAGNDDIAAVIYEPTGSSFGQVPLGAEFAQELRRLCTQYGVLLIFDEVVTGFRATKGGAQMAFGVSPDLSSFAKIVAGGLPGACVAGRKDILDLLDFNVAARTGREKIAHPGTFNANPVSAAAGTAALTVIAETDASDRAAATAADLREKLNAVLADAQRAVGGLWHVFGLPSVREPERTGCRPAQLRSGEDPARGHEESAEIAGEQAAAGDAGERRGPQSARRRAAVMHAHGGRCREHDSGVP